MEDKAAPPAATMLADLDTMSAKDKDWLMMDLLKRAGFTPEEALLKVVGTTDATKNSTSVGREIQRLHAIAMSIEGASVDDISVANNFDVTLTVNNVDEVVRVITERGEPGMINHRDFGIIHYFGDEEQTSLTHKQQLVNVLHHKEPWGDDDDDNEPDLRSLD